MREITTPSNYVKGFILFQKGYVTVRSGGFVEVKSERHPSERPYILRFFENDPLKYEHSCGATAKNPDVLCKHIIASHFSKFPNLILPPNEEIVNVFRHYRADGISSYIFDKDAGLYGVGVNISDPKLAEHLWVCLLARMMSKRLPRLNKSTVENSYEDLLLNRKYLTAKLKSLISSGNKEDQVCRVLGECDDESLSDIILKGEVEGIKNTKAIIHRAFKEDLLLPRNLGEAYLWVYQQYSDLNLVL